MGEIRKTAALKSKRHRWTSASTSKKVAGTEPVTKRVAFTHEPRIRTSVPVTKTVDATSTETAAPAMWQQLAAEGKKTERMLVEQLRRAEAGATDLNVGGIPIEVKYYTSTGREVSTTERIAAARARRVADDNRGIETPDWIVRLSDSTP